MTATVPVGKGPWFPVVLPDGSAVYVPNVDDGTVSVIDVQSLEKVADLETGPRAVSNRTTTHACRLGGESPA